MAPTRLITGRGRPWIRRVRTVTPTRNIDGRSTRNLHIAVRLDPKEGQVRRGERCAAHERQRSELEGLGGSEGAAGEDEVLAGPAVGDALIAGEDRAHRDLKVDGREAGVAGVVPCLDAELEDGAWSAVGRRRPADGDGRRGGIDGGRSALGDTVDIELPALDLIVVVELRLEDERHAWRTRVAIQRARHGHGGRLRVDQRLDGEHALVAALIPGRVLRAEHHVDVGRLGDLGRSPLSLHGPGPAGPGQTHVHELKDNRLAVNCQRDRRRLDDI